MNCLSLLNFGAVEITFTVLGVIAIIALVLLFVIVPMKEYFTALFAKAHISMAKLTSLKNCKIAPMSLVEAYILSKRSNVDLKVEEIESVLLASGNAKDMISAMKLAKEANIALPFSLASALEIKTKNSLEVVRQAVESFNETITDIKAVSKDNVELVIDCNLILKILIPKYLFGLSSSKIKAYVTEKIIKKVPTLSKNEIMNNPEILLDGIDLAKAAENTAYSLQEVMIANISIGRNFQMDLEIKKAEKERVFAQMQADRMKTVEEMKELRSRTKTEETKASLLEAEAQVPIAISQAIKEGRFSVMDYYKLMNLQADTALRRSIMNSDDKKEEDDDTDFDAFDDGDDE